MCFAIIVHSNLLVSLLRLEGEEEIDGIGTANRHALSICHMCQYICRFIVTYQIWNAVFKLNKGFFSQKIWHSFLYVSSLSIKAGVQPVQPVLLNWASCLPWKGVCVCIVVTTPLTAEYLIGEDEVHHQAAQQVQTFTLHQSMDRQGKQKQVQTSLEPLGCLPAWLLFTNQLIVREKGHGLPNSSGALGQTIPPFILIKPFEGNTA